MNAAEYDVVLPDRTRVPLAASATVGRDAGSTIRLDDRSVSHRHALLTTRDGVVELRDVGSSHGTWVDGRRVGAPVQLHDGSVIRLGDQRLVLERRRRDSEAGLTVVTPQLPDAPLDRPRLRAGLALKRLDASEGQNRWVLRDMASDRFLRLSDRDGRLLALLDGQRSVLELMEADPARAGGLLAELADRGLLDGGTPVPKQQAKGLLAPREFVWPQAGEQIEQLYRDGGRRLVTPTARVALAVVAALGLVVFAYLVFGRYGTPFVVAGKIGLGGLVFLIGRLAIASIHELAHGLVMSSFGRRVGRAGLKLVVVFPYVFVDTSEAWFEPRRHRIAVSAAGPVSDAVLGGTFAIACLVLGPGAVRDVCFQLAFAAYLGALVNLNPFVERDGYHILADALREPGLRRRSRVELRRLLAGDAHAAEISPALKNYAIAGLAWSAVAACGAVVVSQRYAPAMRALLPDPFVWVMLVSVWAAVFAPAALLLGPPLAERFRRSR